MVMRALVVLVLLAVAGGVWLLGRPSPVRALGPPEAGTVRFVRDANTDFDRFLRTRRHLPFINAKYWRMHTYSPFFDRRVSWYRDAWVYQDLQAIYPGSNWALHHPEWILRDPAGRMLYVPYDCKGGTCPQYAADIGDPAFRAAWLDQTARKLRHGYRGVFIDDVNMSPHVGDGDGHVVMPIDDRTGTTMTARDWNRYMAEFVEAARKRFPGVEMVHNPIWFFGDRDPLIRRQLRAADIINFERGVNDAGIRGGAGKYGLRTLFAYIDRLHAAGKSFVFASGTRTDAGREYGLAAYFLVSAGRDAISNDDGGSPTDWWEGYDVRLGAPLGRRERWHGLWRREFQRGVVLLNEPDARTRSVDVGDGLTRIDGSPAATVRLGGARGAVLLHR